jgi:membrane protease subunit HflC
MLEYLTQDKKNIILECSVVWKIKEPLLFFQAVADTSAAEQRIDDIVCSQAGGMLGITPLSSLISTEENAIKIPEIESSMTKEVNFKMLKDYGIEVNSISISRIALPEDNVKSVITRMITERRAIADKYRAEGMEEAAKIKSQAEREKSDILSAAFQEAQAIIGKGDAEAMQIYSQAYEKDPEFYDFLRTLESYKKILNDKTTIIMPSDSEFLKYLDSPFLKDGKLK